MTVACYGNFKCKYNSQVMLSKAQTISVIWLKLPIKTKADNKGILNAVLCVMKVFFQFLQSNNDSLTNHCKDMIIVSLVMTLCLFLWSHSLWIDLALFTKVQLEILSSTAQTALEQTSSILNTYSLLLFFRIHIHFLLCRKGEGQTKV